MFYETTQAIAWDPKQDDHKYADPENSVLFSHKLNLAKRRKHKKAIRRLSETIRKQYHETGQHTIIRNRDAGKKLVAIQILVSNLVACAAQNKVLAIPLSSKRYTGKMSYRHLVGYAFKALECLGYITIHKGFNSKYDLSKNRFTRIYMTQKLRSELNSNGSGVSDIIDTLKLRSKPRKLIRLRDAQHKEIRVPKYSALLTPMRRELRDYNDLVAKSHIAQPDYILMPEANKVLMLTHEGNWEETQPNGDYALSNYFDMLKTNDYVKANHTALHELVTRNYVSPTTPYNVGDSRTSTNGSKRYNQRLSLYKDVHIPLPIAGKAGLEDKLPFILYYTSNVKGLSSGGVYVLCRKMYSQLYRVFNLDLRHGGRFYGAEYHQIRSKTRGFLLIDGKPTAELDYSSLHPRMLYQMNSLACPEDPYTMVSDLLPGDDGMKRKLVKIALNVMVNASSKRSAEGAIRNAVREDFGLRKALTSMRMTVSELVRKIAEVHKAISSYFYSGEGRRLMYWDSGIAQRILKYFTDKNIICLCMHDSFIVPLEHEAELEKAMSEAYLHRFGKRCPIKPSGKPTWNINRGAKDAA